VRPMERLAATRPLHRRLPPDTFVLSKFLAQAARGIGGRSVLARWRRSARRTRSDAWTGNPWRRCAWARRIHGGRRSTIGRTRAPTPGSVGADGPAVPVRELEPGLPLTRIPAEEVPCVG
jgi:hypothetical protein